MPPKKQITLFLCLYALWRLLAFYFPPDTPLHGTHILNSLVSLVFILVIVYLLLTRNRWGWYLVALELILGGSGGYFAWFGLTLRTWLLVISMVIFLGYKVKNGQIKNLFKENKVFCFVLAALYLAVFMAGWRGYLVGHDPKLIFADAIPYLFLLYYFPIKELLQRDPSPPLSSAEARGLSLPSFAKEGTEGAVSGSFRHLAINAIIAAILGNFLFVAFTFVGFSSGQFVLQDAYYHWYRDVALGKITALPFNFYRLTLNEHLLLIPVAAYFLHRLIYQKLTAYYLLLTTFLLTILSVNLTRIYLVALAVGLLTLYSRPHWKHWLAVSFATVLVFFATFTAVHLAASRGESLGWELFGLRLQSIASPQIEESSFSRMLLLPKIWGEIKASPILGTGLGDTVSAYSPIFKQTITTPHFDWGYLEILVEMGIIGALAWAVFIGYIIRATWPKKPDAARWPLASLATLFIINLTSPALFHVLGVVWLAWLLASHQKPDLPGSYPLPIMF